MKFLLQVASDNRRILWKMLELKTLQVRNKNKKLCNPDFLLIFCLLKESVQMFLEENCKFVNQMLHFSKNSTYKT